MCRMCMGFSSSKSELRDFSSTNAMVECNSREMIDSISHEKLAKNLSHPEIRIIHNPHTTIISHDIFGTAVYFS